MKRTMYYAAVAVLIAVTGFTIANAQGEGQRGRWRGGPGFGGPGPGGFARLADLTDEQRKQVRAILDEERASHEGPPAAVTLHRQLEAELLADSPDDQKIDSLRQQLIQANGEALARQITVQRKVAAVLTAEQRAHARERLAQAPHGRPERGASR